jgi:hypothetical protein
LPARQCPTIGHLRSRRRYVTSPIIGTAHGRTGIGWLLMKALNPRTPLNVFAIIAGGLVIATMST